eukprot:7437766-Pyramimonas_sp.AAC.1
MYCGAAPKHSQGQRRSPHDSCPALHALQLPSWHLPCAAELPLRMRPAATMIADAEAQSAPGPTAPSTSCKRVAWAANLQKLPTRLRSAKTAAVTRRPQARSWRKAFQVHWLRCLALRRLRRGPPGGPGAAAAAQLQNRLLRHSSAPGNPKRGTASKKTTRTKMVGRPCGTTRGIEHALCSRSVDAVSVSLMAHHSSHWAAGLDGPRRR